MNQDLTRLKKLRDQIVGIEMHISMAEVDIFTVEKDIQYLEDLAVILVENIDVLKSDKIVTVASEYKRVTDELRTVNKNLNYYNGMKHFLIKDLDRVTKLKNDTIFEYENLKLQIDSCRAVLPFDISKRKA